MNARMMEVCKFNVVLKGFKLEMIKEITDVKLRMLLLLLMMVMMMMMMMMTVMMMMMMMMTMMMMTMMMMIMQARDALLLMTPATYVGLAEELARE